jgi:hypothetical protein
MGISFFCPIWGSENLDIRSFLSKVSAAGYDGVKMGLMMEYLRSKFSED